MEVLHILALPPPENAAVALVGVADLPAVFKAFKYSHLSHHNSISSSLLCLPSSPPYPFSSSLLLLLSSPLLQGFIGIPGLFGLPGPDGERVSFFFS